MNDSQQLREQMWYLVYGLLTPEETQALIARVKSDPRAARLYAEVRLQSDLVAHAARVEDPELVFQVEPAGKSDQPSPAHWPTPVARARGDRSARWLIGLAATALAALLAVGIFWPQPDSQQLAQNIFAVEVRGPEKMTAGISTNIAVKTFPVSAVRDTASWESEGKPATVDVQVVDAANNVRFYRQLRTGADGLAELELTGELIEPGVRLKVAAGKRVAAEGESGQAESSPSSRGESLAEEHQLAVVDAPLNVQPEPELTYLMLESPAVKPGDAINLYAWNVKAFSGELAPADVSRITIDNAQGVPVAEPMWQVTDNGAAKVEVVLPPNLPADELTVKVQESSGYESQTRLGKLLATTMAQSVRRLAASDRTEELRQKQLADSRLQELESLEKANAEKVAAPDNLQSPAPPARANEYYQSAGTVVQRARKSLGNDGREAAGWGLGDGYLPVPTIAAGQRVTVSLPESAASRRELYAVANCRGVQVASVPVVESARRSQADAQKPADGAAAERTFSFILPPEADGEVEVALVDRAQSPPQVVQRQFFYREPARKLNIAVADGQQQYGPGERVKVTLQVADEQGQPAGGAKLAVRVWNEELVQKSGQSPLQLDDVVRGRQPPAEEQKNAPASGLALNTATPPASAGAPASAAATPVPEEARPPSLARDAKKADANQIAAAPLAEGGEFDRRALEAYYGLAMAKGREGFNAFSDEIGLAYTPTPTVTLASTREQAAADLAAALAAAHQQRQAIVRTLLGISLVGAAAVLLLVGIVAVRRLPSRGKVLLPLLAIAAASVVIGLVWFGKAPPAGQQIALAPATPAAPAAPSAKAAMPVDDAEKRDDFSGSDRAAVPAGGADKDNVSSSLAFGAAKESAAGISDPSAAAAPMANTPASPPQGSRPPTSAASALPAGDLALPALPLAPPAPVATSPANAPAGPEAKLAFRDAPPVAQQGKSLDSEQRGSAERVPGSATTPAAEGAPSVESLATKQESAPKAAAALAPGGGAALGAKRFSMPAAPGSFGGAVPGGAPAVDGSATPLESFSIAPGTAGRGGAAGMSGLGGGGFGGFRGGRGLPAAPTPAAGGESRQAGQLGEQLLREKETAPAALYFNPQLVADANGRVEFEFTLPPGESAYRLLIDAFGKGRLGSAQQIIVGKQAQPAAAEVQPAATKPAESK